MAQNKDKEIKTVVDKKNPTASRIVETIVVDGRLVADNTPGVVQ